MEVKWSTSMMMRHPWHWVEAMQYLAGQGDMRQVLSYVSLAGECSKLLFQKAEVPWCLKIIHKFTSCRMGFAWWPTSSEMAWCRRYAALPPAQPVFNEQLASDILLVMYDNIFVYKHNIFVSLCLHIYISYIRIILRIIYPVFNLPLCLVHMLSWLKLKHPYFQTKCGESAFLCLCLSMFQSAKEYVNKNHTRRWMSATFMQQARYMRAEMRLILQIVTCLMFFCLFSRSKVSIKRIFANFLVCTHRFGDIVWVTAVSDARYYGSFHWHDLDLLGADDECAAEGWNHLRILVTGLVGLVGWLGGWTSIFEGNFHLCGKWYSGQIVGRLQYGSSTVACDTGSCTWHCATWMVIFLKPPQWYKMIWGKKKCIWWICHETIFLFFWSCNLQLNKTLNTYGIPNCWGMPCTPMGQLQPASLHFKTCRDQAKVFVD